jgi:hypothetical protein
MDNALRADRYDAVIARAIAAATRRKALESARAHLSAGERMLLALSERRADNSNASSRALVERLAGHRGIGDSSRTAKLTVVSK